MLSVSDVSIDGSDFDSIDDERLGERLDAAPHVGRHLGGEDVADNLDVAGPRVVPRLDGLPHHPRT